MAFLALDNVFAFFMSQGALFQSFLASLLKVFCVKVVLAVSGTMFAAVALVSLSSSCIA